MTQQPKHKDLIAEQNFNSAYNKYYEQLYYYAYGFIEDSETCKDILGDVFERLWANKDKMLTNTISSYLYSCVRHECIDYIRHDQTTRKYAESILKAAETEASSTPEELDERICIVRKAMNELPEKTRYVLEECYFNNKKYKEVADSLNISSNAIKKHIMKAFLILREKLSVTKS